jgi:hypothetical protein
MSDEPNFYEEDENDNDNGNLNNSIEENFQAEISEIKEREKPRDGNCSFEIDIERKKSEEAENISMSMVKKEPKKDGKKIPEKIFKDDYERPSLNSSIKSDNNNEDNEPDFYNDEEEIEVSNNNNKSNDLEEVNNDIEDNINNKDEIKGIYNNIDEIKYQERITKRKEDLKKKSIDINNIFEINELFDYDKDNPVFYLKENKQVLDRYPWPLSTKQIVSIIQKENLDYNELRVKLVDIFEFKLKAAFSYVDFINVIKPEWAKNVECSKIFKDLHNFMNGKKNKSKIDKPEDKKDPIKISQSAIPKASQTNTFSVENKLNNLLNDKKEKEEEIKKKEVKQYYPGKKARKAKKRRPGKGDAKLKVGFSYD